MDARFVKGCGKFRKVISKGEFDFIIKIMEIQTICKALSWDSMFKVTLIKSRALNKSEGAI